MVSGCFCAAITKYLIAHSSGGGGVRAQGVSRLICLERLLSLFLEGALLWNSKRGGLSLRPWRGLEGNRAKHSAKASCLKA